MDSGAKRRVAALAVLPDALLCAIFAFLPLINNRALARCCRLLAKLGATAMASPRSVVLDLDSRPDRALVVQRMADSVRPRGLTIRSRVGFCNSLAHVSRIVGLEKLALDCHTFVGLDALALLPALTDLTLRHNVRIVTTEIEVAVGRLTGLVRLHVQFGRQRDYRTSLLFLAGLTRLESLAIEDPTTSSPDHAFWDPLLKLEKLRELAVLHGWPVDTPRMHPGLATRLSALTLRWPGLTGDAYDSVRVLAPALRSLDLYHVGPSVALAPIFELTGLEQLALRYAPRGKPPWPPRPDGSELLGFFSGFPRLRTLTLRNAKVTDLSQIEKLVALATLRLEHCHELTSLAGLSEHVPLRRLDVSQCGYLADIAALGAATQLRSLSLLGCFALCCHGAAARAVSALNRLTGIDVLQMDAFYNTDATAPALRRLAFGDACSETREACSARAAPGADHGPAAGIDSREEPAGVRHMCRLCVHVASEAATDGWRHICPLCGAWSTAENTDCADWRCTHVLCSSCVGSMSHSFDRHLGMSQEDFDASPSRVAAFAASLA